MAGYFSNFLTNKRLFSDQFNLAAENLVGMAGVLETIVNVNARTDIEILFKQVDKKENTGDRITHKIYLNLDKIVFTPIARPDIQALASGIDDVADTIREAAGRMYLYHIDEFSRPVKELSSIILNACLEIQKAVALVFTKKTKDLALACHQVDNYRHQADTIYYTALGNLFLGENNAVKLIKYREVLLSLDASVKKCQAVTNVFNTIMIG